MIIVPGVIGTLSSKEKKAENTASDSSNNSNSKIMAGCAISSSQIELDINNVRAMVLNGGDMWWDETNARYEVPKIDDPTQPKKHSIFAGAIWIGGVDPGGNLYVAAQRYRQGNQVSYWPGPLNQLGSITPDECLAWDQHFKINKSTIDDFVASYNPATIDITAKKWKTIRTWPGKNNPDLLVNDPNFGATLDQDLAPFFDVDGDGDYNPINGDYPCIDGDQAIWWVINDAGGQKVGMEPENAAIGLEIQIMAFAFATNDLINNMTFYKNILINKGNITLNNTYLGQWVDPDLGQFDDDFVGCDVARGLGICFNGDEFDEGVSGYGENPPAVGVDFFKGPVADPNDGIDNDRDGEVDEPGELIIMSNFLYYNNNADGVNGGPVTGIHYYNYLRNIWKDNTLCVYDGGDGVEGRPPDLIPNPVPCNFMFPGDTDPDGWGVGGTDSTPVSMPVWTEKTAGNTPADRRFIQSAGPFTLKPGAVNDLTIGVVWARVNRGGATGSIGLLKVADDMAQKLFDNNFSLLNGPNAPDLLITELDQELILSLVQDTFSIGGGGGGCGAADTGSAPSKQFTTETYVEVDNALTTLAAKDNAYRFQGYLLYQVKDFLVKATDVDDPDRARLVLQMDIEDGTGDLINEEFDPDVNAFVPRLKVSGADKGIVHTLQITKDLFASGDPELVNFKTYYFIVIAYGANTDPVNNTQYLAGRGNIGKKVDGIASGNPYTAIPHKSEPENDGTVLNSSYGTGIEVTRIHGTGNGGEILELADGEEDKLVQNYSLDTLIYAVGNGPLNIKVYDPVGVKEGNFTLQLSSRLVYSKASANGKFAVGDTVVNTGVFSVIPPNAINTSSYQSLQKAGEAIVRRIVKETDSTIIMDVEMLNDEQGGTFIMEFDSIRSKVNENPPPPVIEVFVGYRTKPMPFVHKYDSSVSATCVEFVLHDYWRLIDDNNDTIYSQRTITEFDEQLVPAYGFSIQLKHANNPNYRIEEDRNNGFREATIEYENESIEWLEKIDDPAELFSTGAKVVGDNGIDPGGVYKTLIDSTWASYGITAKTNLGGSWYPIGTRTIYNLNNVDVVITSDTSKWTRCPVLQVVPQTGTNANLRILKNVDILSVGKDGKPDGTISPYRDSVEFFSGDTVSFGMSWFPGYAIDLDKGIRLSLMFAESSEDDKINGNDLIWEPTTSANGGRSYIYITPFKYDGGDSLEYVFDSLIYNNKFPNGNINPLIAFKIKDLYNELLWVGNPKLNSDFSLRDQNGNYQIPTDVRIRLRVNRYYTSYQQDTINPANPEYFFNTKKLISTTNDLNTAKSALDLIRVVPNPYYAFSTYETSQIDNRIKFTNLPRKCDISIYTLNGTLIRRLRKDDPSTFLDWDLKNQLKVPVASGAYIIHIDAGDIGEKVVKWFGILRPLDLDSF